MTEVEAVIGRWIAPVDDAGDRIDDPSQPERTAIHGTSMGGVDCRGQHPRGEAELLFRQRRQLGQLIQAGRVTGQ